MKKKRYFTRKLYLRLPAITENTLPEMLCSNLPNNVQASSFGHAAIQNGYKGMEKRRASCTKHGERPSLCVPLARLCISPFLSLAPAPYTLSSPALALPLLLKKSITLLAAPDVPA